MKNLSFALIFAAFLCAAMRPLCAQSPQIKTSSAAGIERISAEVLNGAVRISWKENPEFDFQSVAVYRHTEPITADSLDKAKKIAQVLPGIQEYTDRDYINHAYYAAVPVYADGTEIKTFEPFANATASATELAGKTAVMPANIAFISASAQNDSVVIQYTADAKGRRLVLYRSTAPFSGTDSLVSAVIVSIFTDGGAPFIDYPIPNVPYYYALIDEEAVRAGDIQFTAGKNATAFPVTTAASAQYSNAETVVTLRPTPLPYLALESEKAPQAGELSAKSEETLAAVLSSLSGARKSEREKTPYVFPEEQNEKSGGEEYALKLVIDGPFANKQWEQCISELRNFLSLHRSAQTTARAHFYIGQAHYFLGNCREALTEFLLADDAYYAQSREWVQYTLLAFDEQNGIR